MRAITLLLLLSCFVHSPVQAQQTAVQQIGENIQLIRLTENVFVHRSFKVSEEYGRFPSNGLVYIVDSTVVIFDTPSTVKTTTRLLNYLSIEQGYTIKALVVNHFHEDCTAGIDSVQARGIITYGSRKTAALCIAKGVSPPQKKFGKRKTIKLGDQRIKNYFPGPGHSPDNIVSYLPEEKVLFGGCLIKSNGAGRGNTNDAVLGEWSNTVERVQKQFPDASFIVPGHGHHGGRELLEFTAQLFADERE